MQPRHLLIPVAVLALACMGASCSDKGSGYEFTGSSGQVAAGYGYNGPGSAYSVLLDYDGTFSIGVADGINEPLSMIIEGTYERFGNGFVELTVSEATGTGAPDPGDVGMALEAPGFALMLRPFDETGEFVPTVVSGDCPDEDVAGNWMMMACNEGGVPCDADSASMEFFGTLAYDAGTGAASLPSSFNLDDGSDLGSSNIGTTTCENGIMSLSDTVVYLTESGGAIVHTSTTDPDDEKHIVALPEEELVAVTLSSEYMGMVFDKSDDSSAPMRVSLDAAGTTATLYEVDDEELEAADEGDLMGTLSITSVNQVGATPADGWLTATYTEDGGPARPMYCMAATSVGDFDKKLIFCVGQSPNDTEDFYNFVMVSE